MVLVCARCEDGSGDQLDAHAHRIDLYHRIIRGDVFPATAASLGFEGIEGNVQLQRRPGVDYNEFSGLSTAVGGAFSSSNRQLFSGMLKRGPHRSS